MKRIAIAGPSITQREIDYVADAVANCWYDSANRYHDRFEKAFAQYIGVNHAMALPSCTSAIHLALAAMGVGPGDEVIVPDLTWIASAAPIAYVGAEAVFADVDDETWCMAPAAFEQCITEKTKAVILVDLYGNMPQMSQLLAIARRHGIPVIEDAAEAFGSQIDGQQAGSFGDVGVFSFHGSKTMTTGEGGMLVTNRSDLFERTHVLRDHGRVPGDVSFFNREVAFKYKMSSLQAALGLAQLERGEELVARKREIFSWYLEDLSPIGSVTLNPEPPNTRNSYWMTTAIIASSLGLHKDDVQRRLAARAIDTRPFFFPLSALPAYANAPQALLAQDRNRIAYDISARRLNLPSALSLTRDEVRYVSNALIDILR